MHGIIEGHLIEAAKQRDKAEAMLDETMAQAAKLREQRNEAIGVGMELRKERDAARARIAQLEAAAAQTRKERHTLAQAIFDRSYDHVDGRVLPLVMRILQEGNND